MTHPAFFGYGSLVNLATHAYPDPRPARLRGWRRVWRGTALRKLAYLSVTPDPDTVLQGIVATVPHGDWAALDLREAAYRRHDVSHQIDSGPAAPSTAVYQVEPAHLEADARHPILLSYLDVVVQGYLRVFGEDGVAHFFATTDGWDNPILNDRDAPQYPRHQQLTPDERAQVDEHVAKTGARIARA